MAYFPNEDAYPYTAVVFIDVRWSDGSVTRGSGAVVGRNDILTAAHVVMKQGKTATDINVYPAYDGQIGPYGAFESGTWRTAYYGIYQAPDGTIDTSQVPWDIAVIGLSDPMGDRTGTFGLASWRGAGNYEVAGFPVAQGYNLTADYGYVPVVGDLLQISGLYVSSGSSGGPIFDAARHVVGVVSTEFWGARIDAEWNTILDWMSANDTLMLAQPSTFAVTLAGSGSSQNISAANYAGPVAHVSYQYLGSSGAEAIGGTNYADFINALAGNDAVSAGAGRDVIDGGLDSNFLTGGADRDVFFLDGRSLSNTWSTITDWEGGEQLSLWGWVPGLSRSTWDPTAGAAGWQGVTLHCDLNGDGLVETSVTWTGRSQAQLPAVSEFSGLLWFA